MDYVMSKILTERVLNATVSKLFRNPDDQINRIFIPSREDFKVKNELW
jgi:hypothetical protein